MRGQQEKQLKLQQGWVCYADFILLEDCPSTGFCCDLEPSFFFWYREGDTFTMEIYVLLLERRRAKSPLPSAQKNTYAEVAYLRVAYSSPPQT